MQYYDKCLIQNGLSCAGFTNIIIDLFPIKTIVSFSNQLLLSINRFIQGTVIQIYTRYTIEKNIKKCIKVLAGESGGYNIFNFYNMTRQGVHDLIILTKKECL